MKSFVLALTLVALSGCATYQAVPAGYQGPLAYITDSVEPEDGSKARIFAVMEIDGNRVANSFSGSSEASAGRGFALSTRVTTRMVPPKPMKLTLRGSHATAAPIHAMASQLAGTFFSVEGLVDFDPKPETRYVVKGVLNKASSSVWIEEAETGVVVTKKVSN